MLVILIDDDLVLVAFEPGLEHEDGPEWGLPLALVFGVFVPEGADGGGVEDALVGELFGGNQVFGPGAKLAAKPLGEWDAEALFWALEQVGGDVLGKNCAQ